MARYRAGPDLTADQLLRQRIERALTAAPRLDLAQAAEGLAGRAGLPQRAPAPGTVRARGRLHRRLPRAQPGHPRPSANSAKTRVAVRVLFQFTSDEIPGWFRPGRIVRGSATASTPATRRASCSRRWSSASPAIRAAPTRGSSARSTSGCERPRSSSFAPPADASRWPSCTAARTSVTRARRAGQRLADPTEVTIPAIRTAPIVRHSG